MHVCEAFHCLNSIGPGERWPGYRPIYKKLLLVDLACILVGYWSKYAPRLTWKLKYMFNY